MRGRSANAALVVLVIASGGVAYGKIGVPRTARAEYVGPNHVEAGGAAAGQNATSNLNFETRARERFVAIEVRDATGEPVAGQVSQARNGSPLWSVPFCGRTKSLRITPRVSVRVGLLPGGCRGGLAATPTRGIVLATFTP